jgi:hypothetical protein
LSLQTAPPATAPYAASIGTVSQIAVQPNLDTARGQVHINPALAGSTATAASFNYFSELDKSVTPLLFSYDATNATYTLTGIGTSMNNPVRNQATGIPFYLVSGSQALSADTVFGFYDGSVTWTSIGVVNAAPEAPTVPYQSVTSDSWLSTDATPMTQLKIGETFSLSNTKADVALSSSASGRSYASMLLLTQVNS